MTWVYALEGIDAKDQLFCTNCPTTVMLHLYDSELFRFGTTYDDGGFEASMLRRYNTKTSNNFGITGLTFSNRPIMKANVRAVKAYPTTLPDITALLVQKTYIFNYILQQYQPYDLIDRGIRTVGGRPPGNSNSN